MTASAFAARALTRSTGSGRRASALSRRRRARAAFHAAARMVEAALNMPALPIAGAEGAQQRLRGRAIACHIAREAFNVPIFEIAQAAGIDRRSASASTFRLWDRRDADADLAGRIELLIVCLRTMGESRALLVKTFAAARPPRKPKAGR